MIGSLIVQGEAIYCLAGGGTEGHRTRVWDVEGYMAIRPETNPSNECD